MLSTFTLVVFGHLFCIKVIAETRIIQVKQCLKLIKTRIHMWIQMIYLEKFKLLYRKNKEFLEN